MTDNTPLPADGDRVRIDGCVYDGDDTNESHRGLVGISDGRAHGMPVVVLPDGHTCTATAWTVLPQATDLRQAAIDAAVTTFTTGSAPPIISDTDGLESAVEDAVDAAFARISEGLYIAQDENGQEAHVYTDHGGAILPEHVAAEGSVDGRLWLLLTAIIPTREETS